MFDFLHSDIKGVLPEEFERHELLDFITGLSTSTGEISPNTHRRKGRYRTSDKRAQYNHLEFSIIADKHINLSGSLHEYVHCGNNSGSFTFPELYYAIKDLHDKFNLNPHLCLLHNVEFGVNIKLPFPVKDFLDAVVSLKGKEYQRKNFDGKGDMILFVHKQFELKMYDKGKQKKRGAENILRVEIKVRRMDFFDKKGIDLVSFADLLNPDIHQKLLQTLLYYCKHLIIYDSTIDSSEPSKRELTVIQEGNNPRYWKDLLKSNPENFKKKVPRFNELIERYGKRQYRQILVSLIAEKWEKLTVIEGKAIQEVQSFLTETHNRLSLN